AQLHDLKVSCLQFITSRAWRTWSEAISAATFHIAPARLHQLDEPSLVSAFHQPAYSRGRFRQSMERLAAVLVERLNVVVQVRVVLRYEARDAQLRVEGGARELL